MLMSDKNLRNETLNFGPKIKKIREQKHFTVRQAALQANISNSFWSQVENKKREIPKPDTLRKMALGLRISEKEIFKMAGISTPTINDYNKKSEPVHINVEDLVNDASMLTSRDTALTNEDREAIRAMLAGYLNSKHGQDRLREFGIFDDNGNRIDKK